jgi:predicted RNA-binding Zn ribbon-like protein
MSAELVSGWPCLEFINSVDNYRLEVPVDRLEGFTDLVRLGRRVGAISEADEDTLNQMAAAKPQGAARALERAKGLRGLMYRVFRALASGQDPISRDLAALNRWLADVLPQRLILPAAGGFDWSWQWDRRSFDRMLWPLVLSASDLLTSPHLGRLRQCDGHNCTWLFIDRSKNHSRRWCEMGVCGNRAKSRRVYARKKGTRPPS